MVFTQVTSLDFHLTFLYICLIHCYCILASLCRQFTIFPLFYEDAWALLPNFIQCICTEME